MDRPAYILAALSAIGAASLALYLTPSEAKKAPTPTSEKPFARAAQGKALFEEKCRAVAGEKIYRKVENVEGVLLLKVRPKVGAKEWADPMWPGAAFARESQGDGYITTFLGYEYSSSPSGQPVMPQYRGYITTDRRSGGLPGYQFVEVVDDKDGKRYRYSGENKEHEIVDSILGGGDGKRHKVYGWVLEKALSTRPSSRYAVTFEDHVIAEERSLGIASSTIKVIDTSTNEVMGEMTRYAWSPSGPSAANPSPWLRALRCPDHAVGTGAATRKFVDQILIPAKGK